MTAKRKPPARYRARPREEFSISPTMIKWFVGVVGGVFVAYAGWKVVWDDIKTYWRLEAIQAQKDKDYEKDKKEFNDKLRGFAQKADTGRAWVVWSINDSKAFNAEQFAEVCRALKRPEDTCKALDRLAGRQRQDEVDAKRKASESGGVEPPREEK